MTTCVYQDCSEEAVKMPYGDYWCLLHSGMFPHTCTHPGCDRYVQYDDEPKCFTHSPDEGSSVRGYSAYLESLNTKAKE